MAARRAGAAAACVLLLFQCLVARSQDVIDASEAVPPTGVFRVGAVLSSRHNTRTMQDARKGYEFFAQKANAQNAGRGLGVRGLDGTLYFKFNFTSLDDWNDAGNHTEMVRKFLEDDEVHFMFGSHPAFAHQESRSANMSGRILNHCCVGVDEVYRAGYEYVFGVPVSNRRYTELVVSSMSLNNIERVAIVRQTDNIFTDTTCVGAVDAISRVRRTVGVGNNGVSVAHERNFTTQDVAANPKYFDEYATTLAANNIDAVIACALVQEGELLANAVHRKRYPLKAFFITSGPTRPDWVEKLEDDEALNLLSAGQWSPKVNYKDDLFGSVDHYNEEYRKQYGVLPTSLATGASTVGYTIQEAIKRAFRDCDIMATGGDPDKLFFVPSLVVCKDKKNTTGYERVRLALESINIPTVFGQIRLNEFRRNIGMDPVTTQVHLNRRKGKVVQTVLPVTAANAVLKMPAENVYRQKCVPGEFLSKAPEDWFQPCLQCEEGKVSYADDELSCRPCPPGQFWESTTDCSSCPANTDLTNGTLKDSCICSKGYFHRYGLTGEECTECPVGATCEGGTAPPCPDQGYWMDRETLDVYRCEQSEDCAGGCQEDQCQEGHTGRLCSKCDNGYFLVIDDCRECFPAVVIIAMMVSLLVAWYVINVVVSTNVASLDMLLTWAQLANIIGEVDLSWPSKLNRAFGIANILDFDVDILSPKCLSDWNFAHSFVVQLLLPLFMTLLAVVGYWTSWLVHNLGKNDCLKRKIRSQYWLLHWLIEIPENEDQLSAKWDRTIAAFFSSLEVTYVTISKYCFDAFKCDNVGGVLVLRSSPDIECGSGEHEFTKGLAIFGTAIYSSGYLLFVAWKLWTLNRKRSFPDPVNLRRYGWLYRRFELDYYWTSLVILTRKLLFVMVLVFLNNPAFQAGALAIIINGSLMLHVYTAPYVDSFMDILFSFLLVALMFEAFGGVMFYSDNLPDDNRVILEWIVLASLFMLLVVFIAIFCREMKRLYYRQEVKRLHVQALLHDGRSTQKWEHIATDSKKQHRSQICHELLDTFEPSFLYSALVRDPKNIVEWDKLTDMLKDFMSDQSETSYLSKDNKAKFWRNLVDRFPELVDFLAVTDQETRANFTQFATALYKDFYLKKKIEGMPLVKVLNWRDRAPLAQWLALASTEERECFTSIMKKLFHSARCSEAAETFELKVASSGRSFTETKSFSRSPFSLDLNLRKLKHCGIIKEIKEDKGPLTHTGSSKRMLAPFCQCSDQSNLMDTAEDPRLDYSSNGFPRFPSRISEEIMEWRESSIDPEVAREAVINALQYGKPQDEDSSSGSMLSLDVEGLNEMQSGVGTEERVEPSQCPDAVPSVKPTRTLDSFKVFDSAKERPEKRTTFVSWIFDYVASWGQLMRENDRVAAPNEQKPETSSFCRRTMAESIENRDSAMASGDGGPSQ